jgi:ArsR family transcriptional regulator
MGQRKYLRRNGFRGRSSLKSPSSGSNTSNVIAAETAGPHPVSGEFQGQVEAAALLSTVADPIRLTVLSRLGRGPVQVARMLDEIDVAPNLLSYHLRVLRESGLVLSSRRGRCIDYRISGDALARLHAALPVEPEEGIPLLR